MPPQTTDARSVTAKRLLGSHGVAWLGLPVALVVLTIGVERGGWPVLLDYLVARHLPAPGAGGLGGVVMGVAWLIAALATPIVTVALTLGAGAWWSWREKSAAALRTMLPPVVAMAISVLVGKALFHRVGPPGSKTQHLLGYYPSGHTATALVCTATLAVLAGQRHPTWSTRLRGASACWTAVVALALVFHRYHWLSDVIAAWLLGAVILMHLLDRRAPILGTLRRT